jgi:hypothetical protein
MASTRPAWRVVEERGVPSSGRAPFAPVGDLKSARDDPVEPSGMSEIPSNCVQSPRRTLFTISNNVRNARWISNEPEQQSRQTPPGPGSQGCHQEDLRACGDPVCRPGGGTKWTRLCMRRSLSGGPVLDHPAGLDRADRREGPGSAHQPGCLYLSCGGATGPGTGPPPRGVPEAFVLIEPRDLGTAPEYKAGPRLREPVALARATTASGTRSGHAGGSAHRTRDRSDLGADDGNRTRTISLGRSSPVRGVTSPCTASHDL